MKTWSGRFLTLLMLLSVFSGCRTSPPRPPQANAVPVPPELLNQPYLFEVVRHLYRWYLDENEINRVLQEKRFVFWVRGVHARLDPEDQSVLGEIVLPQLQVRIRVKKANYAIEELHTKVKSDQFKITQISRESAVQTAPQGRSVVEVETQQMLDFLFRTRNQRDYPDSELFERLRLAVRQELAKEGMLKTNTTPAVQIVHLAPLSPVANECWAYWETGRKLLHFSSDIELSNPAVWEHETLMVRFFDVDQQVVVSHEEAPGSNRFLTRAEVGRALYNCMVLGQRLETQPPSQNTSSGEK